MEQSIEFRERRATASTRQARGTAGSRSCACVTEGSALSLTLGELQQRWNVAD
jgi:hypothetical protein